ncbi:MAG: sterol desaturase family protein [Candidatus Marinimicrobia bacterium]|jgi:sterol desaturase/sphingolipid hydroxylase (fatty acid hydroxylase superfamily)|nr:sterol desaturase family protein [Candidatus Neomarinimicrobiota bacterium]
MQDLLIFFETVPSSTRSIFLVSGLGLFFSLEAIIPLFKMDYKKVKHAGINLTFTLITLVINLIGASLIVAAVDFSGTHQSGLLNMIALPLWLYVIIGLTLLDLIGAWLIHWIQHHVKWMWMFHLIHHTDPNIDVTSGLRHHPGENIFRLLFTTLAVLVTGASFGLVLLYQTISAFFAGMTHANIQFPKLLDKPLSWIFVTPHFHKIHHHYILPQTDSNYGNIFSIWDHVFSTTTRLEMEELKYGIDTHLEQEEHSNIKNLLLTPFQKYRSPIGAKFDKKTFYSQHTQ